MWSAFLDWFEEHKVAVIGTLTVHTLGLFALTVLHMRTTPREDEISEIRMELISEEEALQIQEAIQQEALGIPQEVKNLTSNITAEVKPTFSQAKLAERVENDLRAFEQEEFDRLAQERRERGEEVEMPQLDPSKWNKELYMDKAAEPVKVEGATTVWHDLQGRVRENDVPGYLCRTQGRVAVRITVDRSGRVQKAEVDPSRSANADECMIEHALRSSQRARFNALSSAPDPQKGTVFFLFMPQ
ncbi:MAG TPA: energy transducer TonB [Flavobacteriales bacterium]|nr:energy transducer TonB [Flavobacteriales bacterium]